jgi:tetratricopeptide (TPR) repeat protein
VEVCPRSRDKLSRKSCSQTPTVRWTLPHTYELLLRNQVVLPQFENETLKTLRSLVLCPKDHPDYPQRCLQLRDALWEEYQKSGNEPALLDECIGLERGIFRTLAPGHPARLGVSTDLLMSLGTVYNENNELSILEEAVAVAREVYAQTPPVHRDRGQACGNLANFLLTLWTHNKDGIVAHDTHELLMEAIEIRREAAGLYTPLHDKYAEACEDLAFSLRELFKLRQDTTVLDEAILLERNVLSVRPPGHPDRARSCSNLAKTLQIKPPHAESPSPLRETILLLQEAFRLHPKGTIEFHNAYQNLRRIVTDPLEYSEDHQRAREIVTLKKEALRLFSQENSVRALVEQDMAVAFFADFKASMDRTFLDEAIALQRTAIESDPRHLTDSPPRSEMLAHLATYMAALSDHTGDPSLLDEAIRLEREALDMHPLNHPDRLVPCTNLAISLKKQFDMSQSMEDAPLLHEAYSLEQEALALQPERHPGHARACENLSLTLRRLFELTKEDVALLDKAVSLQREALDSGIEHSQDDDARASSFAQLARLLFLRAENGDVDALAESVHLCRTALELRPHGHPERGTFCSQLSVALLIGQKVDGDAAVLAEALALAREGVELRGEGHPDRADACYVLANLLKVIERTNQESHFNEAAELYREVLRLRPNGHPQRVHACQDLAHLLASCSGDKDSALLEAAALQREVVAVRRRDDPERAISCVLLAGVLVQCSDLPGQAKETLRDEAIAIARDGLANDHAPPALQVIFRRVIAGLLLESAKDSGSTANLDEAIRMQREVVDETLTDDPDHPELRANLAESLEVLFDRTGHSTVIDEALRLQQQALELLPADHAERNDFAEKLASLQKKAALCIGD